MRRLRSPDSDAVPVDDDIVDRVRAGDPDAFAALFHRHAGRLHRLVRQVVESDDDADDVVQELFIGLPEALERYEERGVLGAWLARVAIRIALTRRRRDGRRAGLAPTEADADLFHATPTHGSDPLERLAVDDAIGRLPKPLRDVVLLRIAGGCTHADVAATLGITEGAARVRLHRALRLLHHLLGAVQ
ncbi:MAG: sigma-70 family RNA polymerase sigma factor [Gemmatimonadaceae bacterium]|jgi:RNA polymerase sigma-70 factor (ECF subfamily)|nr:sigma-70 family RNA polymerase sigma factor [Gemmatimonadaceae bacterium]